MKTKPGDSLSYFMPGTSGNGVVLVHGLTGAPSEMKLVARQFLRRGYSVYAPLLAGHGKDAAALRRTNWRDWLDSLSEAIADFAPEVDRLHAAGICVGGQLSLLAADRQPDTVRAVGLYSPCFNYDGWAISRGQAFLASQISWLSRVPFIGRLEFDEMPSLGIKDERARRLIAEASAEGVLERFPASGLIQMYRLGLEMRKRLPSIRTPTLILHSEEDDVASPVHARYIQAHIGGPSELRFITDSYHMIHVDRQYRDVANHTANFFETCHAA